MVALVESVDAKFLEIDGIDQEGENGMRERCNLPDFEGVEDDDLKHACAVLANLGEKTHQGSLSVAISIRELDRLAIENWSCLVVDLFAST